MCNGGYPKAPISCQIHINVTKNEILISFIFTGEICDINGQHNERVALHLRLQIPNVGRPSLHVHIILEARQIHAELSVRFLRRFIEYPCAKVNLPFLRKQVPCIIRSLGTWSEEEEYGADDEGEKLSGTAHISVVAPSPWRMLRVGGLAGFERAGE